MNPLYTTLINDIGELKEFINVYHTDDDILITSLANFAVNHIKDYTGLTIEQIQEKRDSFKIALFLIVADLYDNRGQQNLQYKTNLMLKSILDLYCVNYL